MTSYLYVYEQRGVHDLEIGKGFHFHMILKNTDKTFHRLLKETKNTFKSLLGDTCTSAIDIDARYDRDMPNTIKYLIELKQDPAKHLKQQYDVKFREKYALKPYYIKNFVL